MPVRTSSLGYPRIGEDRELKFALEGYWSGGRSSDQLESVAASIRQRNWQTQKDAGIDLISSNDFSFYDHVLDTTCLVGAIPDRFAHIDPHVSLDTYFALARGKDAPEHICHGTHDAISGVVAQSLRKWFDTNYHYLVPELRRDQQFQLSSDKPFREFSEALEQNIRTKPVLLGPVSYLLLGRCDGEEFDRLELLDRLLPVFGEVLQTLNAQGAEWVQLDEPTLVLDLEPKQQQAFVHAYQRLRQDAGDLNILLGTYFGALRDNLDVALSLPVDAVHLDAVEAEAETAHAVERISSDKTVSLGVVDGRNIWKNDLQRSLELLRFAKNRLGEDRLIIAPSSSLLHVPYTVQRETGLPPDVHSWLAFAREKLQEVMTLKHALDGNADAGVFCADRTKELDAQKNHPLVHNDSVQKQSATIEAEGVPYRVSIDERRKMQHQKLQLPIFPTTTIGSFPQTDVIRGARARHRKGQLSDTEYDAFLRKEIADVIRTQEEAGLDILVHGESERNDMVQYFAEQLNGIVCTEHGWVQSFGSRYVRPPIIYGDVSRPGPITVDWSRYAQSLTHKPVKGMLTGPVTILHWSFVRSDIPEKETCRQIALAMRHEVQELEQAGIGIIQIDEPALREGLPLRSDQRDEYLQWAADAFRLTVSQAKPETQIHTHMCYGDVRDILPVLRDLDIDVISIEAARSRLAFLDALQSRELPCDIGPGVWDIHSPRVPATDELIQLIERARTYVPDERLWINPDCGLKTRTPEEVCEALEHLVEAARRVRSSLSNNARSFS
ncbi:5-methyltetrahydropteroyltriglutamate--homocysteine S-methyltransferase [Candidatus Peregrinibacteria bacterium]|nr:5-methyltetrahydropteroyltriglutamate--homocysteine S-methyltransferase [Candidatus Peregrinibacteria bacterium]